MYLFFDTETTGLPIDWRAPPTKVENWPRIVQLGWAVFDIRGKEVGAQSHLIKPKGFTIPLEAVRVHGITTEKAAKEGVSISDALSEFSMALRANKKVVAHNIEFDESVLLAESYRTKNPFNFEGKRRFCTMKMSTEFCGLQGNFGPKWPKLSELHEKLFGSPHADAHDARTDILACAKCFFELRRLKVIAD